MTPMLRKKELLLLSCLRQHGRMSLTQASKRTRIPISTLFEKLKRYNKEFIRRSTVLLNFEALGYGTRASIFLRTTKNYRDSLEQTLMDDESINTVFKITNGWDFQIEGIFRNLQELQNFLERLEEAYPLEKQIHFILSDLKKEEFLISSDKTGKLEAPELEEHPDTFK